MPRQPPGEGDAHREETAIPPAAPVREAGAQPEPPHDAAPAEVADAEPAPRSAERPDPSGVTAVAGALRALDRAPRAVVDETAAPPEEPSVRIGRIDVVVQAPVPPPASRTEGAPGDILSRTYLRSL